MVLKGSRVALAPLTAADSDVLFQWIRDRDLVLLNGPYRPVGEASHRAWFEAVQQRDDVAVFGIRLLDDDRLVGSCQLHSISPVHRSAELQIRIGEPRSRGVGLGTEAVELLLKFAFDDLNLHRVYLHVLSTNGAAIHLYGKTGFVEEGVLRDGAYIDGRYVDLVVMGLLESERRRP